jgi:hypothetical protein
VARIAAQLKGNIAMDGIHGTDSAWTLDLLSALQLISACERQQVQMALAEPMLAPCLERAETIHLHIKLDDTGRLPCAPLEGAGGVLDHGKRGFVKYRMPGRVNAIFSHIAISADDLRESEANRRARPLLDHIGIDVRTLDAGARAAFDAIPRAAHAKGWASIAQGGDGRVVRCCHTVVDEKQWLFAANRALRPIEVALGPLRDGGVISGCDLRPSHPLLAAAGPACCS